MNPREALLSAYDDLAPFSNRHRWEFYSNLKHIEFLSQYLKGGEHILDVGSGMGIFALALTKLGYKVDGLDKYIFLPDTYISLGQDAITKLQKVWADNKMRVIDIDISTFVSDQKYDCVVNIAVIEHQKNPKKFIEACTARLRTAGLFFCVTPNMVDLLNRLRVLCGRSAFRDLKPFFEDGESFVGHWREYTLRELVQMCGWSSLEVIEARNYRTLPYFNGKNSVGRSLFLGLFQLVAKCIPGARDTNSVISKKFS